MFDPKYTISARLLANIKRIATIVSNLNNKRFSKVVLMELIKRAHEVSAHASTSIEGNPLPLTEVKRVLKTQPLHIRDSEREVLNYNKTLLWLDELTKGNDSNISAEKFGLLLVLRIHKTVMQGLISTGRCGKIRQEPVFVNDPGIRKTIYWPPDHKDVNGLLKELFTYMGAHKMLTDPLILAGIFHKQFVIIHPFMDGNGRTVRLATKVLLSAMGLDTFNLFSFENYYNNNVSAYFKQVGVRGNYYDLNNQIDFTDWLEYFTDGIIDELLRVSKVLEGKNITPENILKPEHQAILKYIEKHGFITDKIYSGLTTRAKPTRNQDLNKLIQLDMIERVGKGKATIYRFR